MNLDKENRYDSNGRFLHKIRIIFYSPSGSIEELKVDFLHPVPYPLFFFKVDGTFMF